MNMHDLLTHLHSFKHCRIAVIGDLMLDEYLWGHIERISPEAPVPILNVVRRESMLGGAGNVAVNLRSLGAHVRVFGVVGQDEIGQQTCDLLRSHGVDISGVVSDSNRRSTRKARLMSLEHGQQVFRLDEESTQAIFGEIEDRLITLLQAGAVNSEALICSDYMKGVLTNRVLSAGFAAAREHGISTIVDPKGSKSQKYSGASVLMPNVRELAQLVGTHVDGDGWLDDSARSLIQRLDLEALVVTRSSEGMSLFESVGSDVRRVDIRTMARSVYDVTGAGDTATAAFAAAVASGSDRETAACLANLAASIKVGKRGTACVSAKELIECISEERLTEKLLHGASAAGAPSSGQFSASRARVS
jgi:D-beta-D-heptose 7-phosphate kinase / D-beta-D-heptose 1-phosphate adenosyltransferase